MAWRLVAAFALLLTLATIAPDEASAGWRRGWGYYGPGPGVYVAPGYGYYGYGAVVGFNLPYVLSQVEQDFIVPENVQALIWQEAVPVLVTSAILPPMLGLSSNK